MILCLYISLFMIRATDNHKSLLFQTQVIRDISDKLFNATLIKNISTGAQENATQKTYPVLLESSHAHLLTEIIDGLNYSESHLMESQFRVSQLIQQCNYSYIHENQRRLYFQRSENFVETTPIDFCRIDPSTLSPELQDRYKAVCETVALVSPDTNINVETSKHISVYFNMYPELKRLYQIVKNADFTAFHSVLDDISIIYPCLATPFISTFYQYRKDLHQKHVLQLSAVRQHFETDTILMILDGSELLSADMLNEIKLLASIYASSISLNVQLRIIFVAYEMKFINEGGYEPLVTSLDSLLKNIQDFDPLTASLGYYVSLRTIVSIIEDFIAEDTNNKTTSIVYIGYGIVRDMAPYLINSKNTSVFTILVSDKLAEKAYGSTIASNLKKHLISFTSSLNGHVQHMDLTSVLYNAELLQEIDGLDDLVKIYRILSERCSSSFYQCIKESNYSSMQIADKKKRKKQQEIIRRCKVNVSSQDKDKLTNCVMPSLLSIDYDLPFSPNTQGNTLLNHYRHKLLLESEFLRPDHYSVKLSLSTSGWLTNQSILIMSTPIYTELPFYGRRLVGFLAIGLKDILPTPNSNVIALLNTDNYKIVWPNINMPQDERLSYFSDLDQKIFKYITEYGFYRSDMIGLKDIIDLQTEKSAESYVSTLELIKKGIIFSVGPLNHPGIFQDSTANSAIIYENGEIKHVCLKNRLCAEPDVRIGLYDIVIYNWKYRLEEYPRAVFRIRIIILEEYGISTHALLEPLASKGMTQPFYKNNRPIVSPLNKVKIFSWLDNLINGNSYSSPYILDPCQYINDRFCLRYALKLHVTDRYLQGLSAPPQSIVIKCACPLLDFYTYADQLYTPPQPNTVSQPKDTYMYAMIYPPSQRKSLCSSWYMNVTIQRYLIQFFEGASTTQSHFCCGPTINLDDVSIWDVCAAEFSTIFWELSKRSYQIMAFILGEILRYWKVDLPTKSPSELEILLSNAYYLPPRQIIAIINPSLGIYLSTHYLNFSYSELMTSETKNYAVLTGKLCRNTSAIKLLSGYSEDQINKYFTYISDTSKIITDAPFYRAQSLFKIVLLERVDLLEERMNNIIEEARTNVGGIDGEPMALILNTYGVSLASSSLEYPINYRLDESVKSRIVAFVLHWNGILRIYSNIDFEYIVLPLAELRYRRQEHATEQCIAGTQWENSTYTARDDLEKQSLKNIATNPFLLKDRAYNEKSFIHISVPSISIDNSQVQHLLMPNVVSGNCSIGKLGSLITIVCINLNTTVSTQLLWEKLALNEKKYINISKLQTTDWYRITLQRYLVTSNFDWFFKPQKSIWKEFNYVESPLWSPESGYNDPIKSYCIDLIRNLDVYGYRVSFVKTKLLYYPSIVLEDVILIIFLVIATVCTILYLVLCIYSYVRMTNY